MFEIVVIVSKFTLATVAMYKVIADKFEIV
jgi:hypothetical protein